MKLLLFISSVSSLNQYDSSEPVYFAKEGGNCERIMTDTNGHTLTSAEKNFGGKYLQKVRQDQGSQKKEF